MVSRSFTVFIDEPSEPLPKSAASLTSSSTLTASSATTSEKENLHPLTGEHTTNSSEGQIKKRKSSVLATKLYTPPVRTATSKRDHSLDDGHSAPRKRAITSSIEVKASLKKPRHITNPERTSGGSRVRKPECLPKLEEEPEPAISVNEVAEQSLNDGGCTKHGNDSQDVAQAVIDSKCYALTVSPLADVSRAFEKTSPEPRPSAELDPHEQAFESRKIAPRNTTASTKLRLTERAARTTKGNAAAESRMKPESKPREFSTPERKRIYSSFTFASPSPTSARFAAARPGHRDNDRFGDIKFNFS